MLNRAKLLQELELVADQLFIDTSADFDQIKKVWQLICSDPLFSYRLKQVEAPWPVPSWQGALDGAFSIEKPKGPYRVLSVDGSQIYPDRHQNISCYVINIGTVVLNYGCSGVPVLFDGKPFIFTNNDEQEIVLSTELINSKRQELEFQAGLEHARKLQDERCPFLLLFDGSLIFWHLEAKDMQLRDYFLPRYLATLHQLSQDKIPTASYISQPKSRELINLIRLQLSDFKPEQTHKYEITNGMVDAHVVTTYLVPGQRSQLFQNNASISELYPNHLRPYFFYLHVGDEIGRVEIPAWVAHDVLLVDKIAGIVLDQAQKGRGYPVALAEAHEQAVVKGPDRDFFYHMLCKLSIERKHRQSTSQKLRRKQGMGI